MNVNTLLSQRQTARCVWHVRRGSEGFGMDEQDASPTSANPKKGRSMKAAGNAVKVGVRLGGSSEGGPSDSPPPAPKLGRSMKAAGNAVKVGVRLNSSHPQPMDFNGPSPAGKQRRQPGAASHVRCGMGRAHSRAAT